MANDLQNRAAEYRARAREARARAAAAPNKTIRKTQLDDAAMFERMAESEEQALKANESDAGFLDWEPDRFADHYRLSANSYKDKAGDKK